MAYYFSAEKRSFYPESLRILYENSGTWPSDAIEISDEEWLKYSEPAPAGKYLGSDDGNPVWVDLPPTPNSELLKVALSRLSAEYQGDIESLNRAWLAAAVNDGINETTKKDAVLTQINARKSNYSTDRAAVIAQYPV